MLYVPDVSAFAGSEGVRLCFHGFRVFSHTGRFAWRHPYWTGAETYVCAGQFTVGQGVLPRIQ